MAPRSHTPLQSAPLNPTDPPSCNLQPAVPNISRAPVRYNLPLPPPEIPESEADLAKALRKEGTETEETDVDQESRSLRPGQKGFAQRLLSKYGWTKGSGLGASGTGIVNPLRVQVEKQKKKPDSEGGGYVGPGGRGKIIGGKRAGDSGSGSDGGKFGVMSEVIVLHGMVDGLDLDAEMEHADDGGLLQEIGDECGEKVSARPILCSDLNPDPVMSSMAGSSGCLSMVMVPPILGCLSNSRASCRH